MKVVRIEKNVSLPPVRSKFSFIDWAELKVGDSFLVTYDEKLHKSVKSLQAGLVNNALSYATNHRKKFKIITRSIGNVVRVWRVE